MALNGAELLDYASLKFQEAKYDEALEAFVLVYMKGFEQQWIIETIYNCYMEGNIEVFQKTFQCYRSKVGIGFDECILDFIPCRDGEYYIFDKADNIFRGRLSIRELLDTKPDPTFGDAEFSAAAWEMEWDFRKFGNILTEGKDRKLYVICQDLKRACSFFKIPELAEYWENVMLFPDMEKFREYFHAHTMEYLPRVIAGNQMEAETLETVIEREHEYRLTPEGRNTSNILLTIGIPTYNRGNLLLKRLENLKKMPYDAEIEIAISKNGIDFYQEEYQQISKIPDSRIQYYDHGKELKITENWHYTVEMARGKYVLFVSDEDDVVLSALEHYLKILSSNPDISMLRAKTCVQVPIQTREYGKKGLEAFKREFLRQNYLSGLIVRRKDFLEENLLQLEQYRNNPFYCTYPHEWWCALLSKKGDYLLEPVMLISENESVLEEETKLRREYGLLREGEGVLEETTLPVYATYEARLKQLRGQADFLHWMIKEDKVWAEAGLSIAISKTGYLLGLAREYHYDCKDFLDFTDKFMRLSMEIIDEFLLEDSQKINLWRQLQNCGVYLMNIDAQLRAEEKEPPYD